MKFSVSDLLFPGFQKEALPQLSTRYGIEFFYEFGKNYYWDKKFCSGRIVPFPFMRPVWR